MYSTGGIAAIVVLIFVAPLMVTLFIPLLGPNSDWPPLQENLGVGTTQESIIQADCGCTSTDPQPYVDFATDERNISNTFYAQDASLSMSDARGLNTFAWVWGQFIDHDIVKSNEYGNTTFTVAFNENINMTIRRVETSNDPVTICREPKNNLSPAVDGSTIYADYKDPARLAALRVAGQCKMRIDELGFPPIENGTFFCGDVRCDEQAILSLIHTIGLREHNRWCDVVAKQRPNDTPEQHFWRARMLTVAVIQRITFEEWLPLLLGSQSNLLYSVPMKRQDRALTTPFSVAAFRFGHSMVANRIGPWLLQELFHRPEFVRTTGVDALVLAALETPAEQVNPQVVDGLRNILFGTFGMDLVTLNLFRGRELGIPTYNQVVQCYGTQGQYGVTLQPEESPQNRDLYLGLFTEPVVYGSSLPRTIAVIISEQFRRLREFDPHFWTKNRDLINSVNLATIQSTTLTSLVERNSGLSHLPANLFQVN